MSLANLNFDNILDPNTREALKRLCSMLKLNPVVNGDWDLIEITTASAVSGASAKHRLGYLPKDAIILYNSGATVTLRRAQFTTDSIVFDTSGPVTFRALIGTAREG